MALARPRGPLGLLMLETRFPRPLGDVGHPETFAFPVVRQVVPGATPERIVRGDNLSALAPFIAAGQALVAKGCVAIATSCGFLARWQAELQVAFPVPVWSSALLQLPELALGRAGQPARRAGVITIEAASLTPAHLLAVGADPATPIEGITSGSALHRTLLQDLPELDSADAQYQVLAAAARLRQRHPDLDALVLECTNLPPYTAALRQASGLPVWDVVTLLNDRMARLGQA